MMFWFGCSGWQCDTWHELLSSHSNGRHPQVVHGCCPGVGVWHGHCHRVGVHCHVTDSFCNKKKKRGQRQKSVSFLWPLNHHDTDSFQKNNHATAKTEKEDCFQQCGVPSSPAASFLYIVPLILCSVCGERPLWPRSQANTILILTTRSFRIY